MYLVGSANDCSPTGCFTSALHQPQDSKKKSTSRKSTMWSASYKPRRQYGSSRMYRHVFAGIRRDFCLASARMVAWIWDSLQELLRRKTGRRSSNFASNSNSNSETETSPFIRWVAVARRQGVKQGLTFVSHHSVRLILPLPAPPLIQCHMLLVSGAPRDQYRQKVR